MMEKPAAVGQNGHLHHLDSLRAFAMLFGVFVHTGTLAPSPPFEIIAWLSDHFRMALFFLVSSMLASLVLAKRSATEYVVRRLFTLLLPFVLTTALLNPPTIALILDWRDWHSGFSVTRAIELALGLGGFTLQEPFTWHLHLWFLVSLAIYSILLPALVSGTRRVADRISRNLAGLSLSCRMLSLLLFVLILGVFQRLAYQIWLVVFPEFWIARATLFYMPFVVAGVVLIAIEPLGKAFSRISFASIMCGAVALGTDRAIAYFGFTGGVVQFATLILKYVITFAMLQIIYVLFLQLFSRKNSLVEVVVRGIFSVYLVHYLLIYLIANLFYRRSEVGDGDLILISCIVIVIGFVIHYAVVEPFALMKTLFNGSLPRSFQKRFSNT
jgi:glucan biosynthesis protein C